jgi:hypothetical protein
MQASTTTTTTTLRKELAYDAPTRAFGDEQTGRRVHYQDLTTIGNHDGMKYTQRSHDEHCFSSFQDWSHDLAKDRVRRKKLLVTHAHGIRAWAWRVYDAAQAWLVVALIGRKTE